MRIFQVWAGLLLTTFLAAVFVSVVPVSAVEDGTKLARVSGADAAKTSPLRWNALPDPQAQNFHDPFAELSAKQLRLLVTVARLREQVIRDAAKQNELDDAETQLSALGVDADVLIAQRWDVAERRRKAARAGNPALDGKTVTIAGFAIPGPPAQDGTKIAYLVALPGLCSHVPPPDPNQMLRLRLTGDWFPERIHEPVAVTGTLTLDPTETSFSVVDGPVRMNATWNMDVDAVETGHSQKPLSFRQGS